MTDKQRLFVFLYLGECRFNATEAARRSGYADPEKQGWQIRQSPAVQQAIEDRVSLYAMSSEEVLAELTDIARNSNIAALLDAKVYGKPVLLLTEEGGALKPECRFLKRVSITFDGVVVEVHDRMAALVQLGKFYGLWVDRQDITSGGGQPLVKVYVGVEVDEV